MNHIDETDGSTPDEAEKSNGWVSHEGDQHVRPGLLEVFRITRLDRVFDLEP
jgi:hypothetical protein